MIYPKIHLNGSDGLSLVDAIKEARSAIDDAIDALRKTAPHGRDYYVIDDKAIGMATAEYAQRVAYLKVVSNELEAIAVNILAQKENKIK